MSIIFKVMILGPCFLLFVLPACRLNDKTRVAQQHETSVRTFIWPFSDQPYWRPTAAELETALTAASPWRERFVAMGESHRFRVEIPENHWLRIELFQCNIDLAMTLTNEAGVALQVDRPSGSYDREWVSYLSETDETIWLDVYPLSASGYYQINIAEWRRAQPMDPVLLRRERLYLTTYLRGESAFSPEDKRANLEDLLSFWEAQGDRYNQAFVLLALSVFYEEMGSYDTALSYSRRAAELFHVTGSTIEALALTNMGANYHRIDQPNLALDAHYRALWINREIGNRFEEANSLCNIAMAYLDLQEFQLSLDYLALARKLVPQSNLEALIVNNFGVAYTRLGEKEKAFSHHRQALEMTRKLNDAYAYAMVTMNLGVAYQEAGLDEEAFALYQTALSLAEHVNADRMRASVYQVLGGYYLKAGEFARAEAYFKKTLGLNEKIHSARAYYELARVFFYRLLDDDAGSKDPDEFIIINEHLAESMRRARELGDLRLEANILFVEAQVRRAMGDATALDYIDKGVALIEDLRDNVTATESRNAFFASNQNFYELYIDLLIEHHRRDPHAGYEKKALHLFEKATARNLMEVLITGSRNFDNRTVLPVFENYWRARHRLEDANAIAPVEPSGAANRDRAEAETELARAEAMKKATNSSNADLVTARILEADQFREQIADPATLILEYALGEKTSHLWAVTHQDIEVFDLPPRAVLEEMILAVRQRLTRPRADHEDDAPLLRLSEALLKPVYAHLRDKKRLCIVAGGAVQLVPFAALPFKTAAADPAEVLLDRLEISYLPSVSVLAAMRGEVKERPPPEKLFLAFADPVFLADQGAVSHSRDPVRSGSKNFEPLFSTRREVENIIKIVKDQDRESVSYYGYDANRERALGPEPRQYRIIHFATHGLVDSDNPSGTSLILSLYDREHNRINGNLDLKDIAHLELNADLVVLSACETAVGKEVRGEGLMSLARGFMFAGAPRVLATLWRVRDDSTAALMKDFYREMIQNKKSSAAALREAQLIFKRDYADDPYFWAGFVLIGDWRP